MVIYRYWINDFWIDDNIFVVLIFLFRRIIHIYCCIYKKKNILIVEFSEAHTDFSIA